DAGRELGLAALPEPSPHDWFFDLETASLAIDHGLEYLWGLSYADDTYDAEWALTARDEKRALLGFLRRALEHIEDHPGAHIYHYGAKEPSTLKRLTARYGEGTDELDTLLKAEVFVDLLRVVKQSLRAGLEGYSLKLIEPLYGFERTVALLDAIRARGVLEKALALKADGRPLDQTRPVVEGYNRDDCISTRVLRDWLEDRRRELEAGDGEPLGRPEPRPAEEEKQAETDYQREIREVMDGLLAGVPDEPVPGSAEQVRWLAAHLIEWHRRENKNWYWEFYRLRDLSPDGLFAERQPICDLEYVECLGPEAKSRIHRFRFRPKEHGLKAGRTAADLDSEGKIKTWNVWAIDDDAGHLDLKIGTSVDEKRIRAIRRLVLRDLPPTTDHRQRLRTTAEHLLAGEDELREWSPTSMGLLRRDPPRLTQGRALPEIAPRASSPERAKEAALALDSGVLPLQGPPGTGKTYTGARMIRALLRAGYRVGVTAQSHKVITNLMDEVCEADRDDPPTSIVGLQASERPCQDPRVSGVAKNVDLPKAMAQREEEGGPAFNLFAGTSWLWCRGEWLDDPVDVLFIDEAGQFSLANALAVAPSARNLVLLGDPQQLNQPQQGVHPPGAEASVLEHLAGQGGIVTAERGLFLEETWRMRPEITAYTSELFYEGQLRCRPHLEEQHLAHPDHPELHGLYHVPVPHEGNARASEEEAAAVVALYRRLLVPGAEFTHPTKVPATRDLECADLLVVAPYNAQVDLLKERLAEAGFPDAHVGTVDKFQGQEAAVAIYSLASSSAEEAPRGMSFLYALDRLNVATSRARCATIIVSSPAVFEAECRTPEQVRMVNAFVRFREVGREWALG
ncbi:MAG: AAA domain-containing protein, partial [Phycisphaerales bacterium JB040]